MTEFRFAYPLALLIFLLPLAIHFVPLLQRWRVQTGTMLYPDMRLLKGLDVSWRVRLRRLPDVLRLGAWVLLVVALARPQTGRAQEIIRGQGIDIVLALDISKSMSMLDFDPQTRLEAAKSVMADFIQRREFDHIGLVVFARNAFHQAPPTLDYDVLLQLLDQVTLVSNSQQAEENRLDTTAIGLGLASSANMLRNSAAISRVIILLTDGDNNAGLDPIQAAEAVATLGIRIYTVGIGRPEQGGLNESLLQEISMIGDGAYFRAETTTGLQQIYNRINMLERSDVQRKIYIRWQDRVAPLLVVILCLLIIERFLRRTFLQTVP